MIRSQSLSLLFCVAAFLAPSLSAEPNAAQEASALTERSLSDHPGLRQGAYEEVREDWISALENDPTNPLAYSAAVCIARMTGQIFEATLSADRLWALAERVPEARASKALRIAALSAFQEKRFALPDSQPPADAFPNHVKHFAALGALGPYNRGSVLRHEPALDVKTLQPKPGSEIGQSVEWRAVERPSLAWYIQPEDSIYPRGTGEGWLLALIKTQPGATRIRVESMDAFQAWWNGERALNELRTSWADLGYDVDVDVEALEGWNALLIRFVGGSTPDIGVQVLDSAGRHVSHESFDFESLSSGEAALPATAQNEGRATTRVPFEINRYLDTSSPWSKALSVAMDGYGRRSDRALSREVPSDEDPAAAAFWRARHIAVRSAVHLPGEVYRRLQLEAEAALERLGVTFPEIEVARIERNLEEELVTESVAEARALAEEFPSCAELRYLVATALDYLDATGTLGNLERERLLEDRPNDAGAWIQRANRAFDAGDISAGIARQRRVTQLDGERTDTLGALIERLSLGTPEQTQEAHGLLERALATSGYTGWLESLRLTLLENEGRFDEIDQILAQRFADDPWDYGLLWDLAQWRLQRPETKRLAIEPLQQYLKRHPRAEYMRDALARIGVPDEAEEFFEAFRADREAALALRDQAPQDASTALLLDSGLVYVHPDGGTHTRFHQLEVALDRTGTEQLHEHGKVGYTRVARVINSEGQAFEPIEVEGAWVMPSLDGGDVVEFEWDTYSQGEEGEAPELGFFFASFEKPFMHSRMAVYVPEGTPGEFKAFQLAQNEVSWEKLPWKNGTVHLFTAKNQERREPERGMPTPQEILPWVQYGAHETEANALALWNEQFAQNSTVAADLEVELREALAERGILELSSPVAKAEGIWQLVHERILDWSGEGDTTDVWTLRRGDSLGLIGAMLRFAEVPFDWGILYPSTRPELTPFPAEDFMTLGDWEMPMIRLRPETEAASPTYVATVVRGMKFGGLQEAFEGAKLWILDDSGDGAPRSETLEFDISSHFGTLLEVQLVVQENGDATVQGSLSNTLAIGPVVRENFKQAEPNQRDQWARGNLPGFLDGLDLESSEFVGLDELGAPFRVDFTGTLPGFAADPAGARPRLPMFRLAEGLGGAERDWPFVARANDLGTEKMQISIEFPEGYEFEYAPTTQLVERQGITAGFKVEREGSKLVLTRHMNIGGAYIEPADFPAFLAEMKSVDEAIDTRVEILARPGDDAEGEGSSTEEG